MMKLTVMSPERSLVPNIFKGNETKIAYSLAVFAVILFASPFATSPGQKSDSPAKAMHAKSTTAKK